MPPWSLLRRWRSLLLCSCLLLLLLCVPLSASAAVASSSSHTRPHTLAQWSVADVQQWMSELARGSTETDAEAWQRYSALFEERRMDGESLLRFSDEQLSEELQISNAQHRRILLEAVQQIVQNEVQRGQAQTDRAESQSPASGADADAASSANEAQESHSDLDLPPSSDAAASEADSSRVGVQAEKRLGDLSMFVDAAHERIGALEAMLAFNKRDFPSTVQLARIYLQAPEKAARAKKLIDNAKQLAPNHPDMLALLGDWHRLRSEWQQAVELYARSLLLDPLSSGDGAELRVHYAVSLYQRALQLFSAGSELACRAALETAVAALNEALLLYPHPSYTPWLTTHVFEAKLTRYNAKQHVYAQDNMYLLHRAQHAAKQLLAECYLKLAALYERQAQLHQHRPDSDARFAQWHSSQAGVVSTEAKNSDSAAKQEFLRLRQHTVQLYALAISYLRRIQSIAPSYVEHLQADKAQKLAPVQSDAQAALQRINQTWLVPREHTRGTDSQQEAASSAEFLAAEAAATRRVRSAQLNYPSARSDIFFGQKLIASVLHSSCRTAAAHELMSLIRTPLRAPNNQTKLAVRGEEHLLQSSAYPFLFGHEGEIKALRKRWEQRLDALLAQLAKEHASSNFSGSITQRVRWREVEQVERTRWPLYARFHGRADARHARKLAWFYEAMSTPLEENATSWLRYTARHLRQTDQAINGLERRIVQTELQSHPSAAASDPLAHMSTSSSSALPAVPPVFNRRVRVAFFSAFLTTHPVSRWWAGLIRGLDRRRFQVQLFWVKLAPGHEAEAARDPLWREIRDSMRLGDGVPEEERDLWEEVLRERLDSARAAVKRHAPDVLLFGQLGSDATSFFLSFSRLAPVQALYLPPNSATSGVPTIDYALALRDSVPPAWFSADDAGSLNRSIVTRHYTERLHLLPDAGWHARPNFTAHLRSWPASAPDGETRWLPLLNREHFGLSNRQLSEQWKLRFNDSNASLYSNHSIAPPRTVYLVAAEAAYFSPSFSEALGTLLARDPSSILLIAGVDPGVRLQTSPAHAAGEEAFDGVQGGMRNACKDNILARIERWRTQRVIEATSNDGTSAFRAVDPVIHSSLVANASFDLLGDILSSEPSIFTPELYGSFVQSGRVRFMPQPTGRIEWLNLLENVDLMLQPWPIDDPLAALDAIQVSLPTVFASFSPAIGGRMTHALYARMGLSSLAASDPQAFIERALQLGSNASEREFVRQRLREARKALYEETAAIDNFQSWIDAALQEKMQETTQSTVEGKTQQ